MSSTAPGCGHSRGAQSSRRACVVAWDRCLRALWMRAGCRCVAGGAFTLDCAGRRKPRHSAIRRCRPLRRWEGRRDLHGRGGLGTKELCRHLGGGLRRADLDNGLSLRGLLRGLRLPFRPLWDCCVLRLLRWRLCRHCPCPRRRGETVVPAPRRAPAESRPQPAGGPVRTRASRRSGPHDRPRSRRPQAGADSARLADRAKQIAGAVQEGTDGISPPVVKHWHTR
jgi:hypothetical protein